MKIYCHTNLKTKEKISGFSKKSLIRKLTIMASFNIFYGLIKKCSTCSNLVIYKILQSLEGFSFRKYVKHNFLLENIQLLFSQ